jgi:GAF domain
VPQLGLSKDLPATLHQAVIAAKQLFDADAAGVMLADIDGRLRWASASDQRAQTLEDNQEVFAAGPCAEAYTTGKPAVMHDATMERRWGEITLTMVEVHIRSGLSVPVDLGGGPIGTWMCMPPTPEAGIRVRSPPCRRMPGGGQPAQRRGHGRGQGTAGRPAPGSAGLSRVDRAGQGRPDGTRTPGRPGGLHPPAPGGPLLRTQAIRGRR